MLVKGCVDVFCNMEIARVDRLCNVYVVDVRL